MLVDCPFDGAAPPFAHQERRLAGGSMSLLIGPALVLRYALTSCSQRRDSRSLHQKMSHVVLLGDSIFDNAQYVPGHPAVIEQLLRSLPSGWQATLAAVDGHITTDVPGQLERVPDAASHLVVSVGGNDALGYAGILTAPAATVNQALLQLSEVQAEFRENYQGMLRAVLQRNLPTTLCTVYDSVPGLGPTERLALGMFNEVILREAFLLGLPVIDLRLVCDQRSDYSDVSPIEPSVLGGAKIALAIAAVVTSHDFDLRRTSIYR